MTEFADITISDNVADGLIVTAIDAGYLTGFADDSVCVFMSAIDSFDFMCCANILISYDVTDELISTDINSENSTDFYDNAAGRLIADVGAGDVMDCAYISISKYKVDDLSAADAGYSTDCADTNFLDDDVDGLIAIALLMLW